MTTGDQNHEYALAIIERKHAEIVALTQRAEAAEEDRDGWKLRAMQCEQQRQSLRAERDALRVREGWVDEVRYMGQLKNLFTEAHKFRTDVPRRVLIAPDGAAHE